MEDDMLKFLRSIFSYAAKQEKYPETLVRTAIERTVEQTDPWLQAVSDYKYRLRPAVILSLDHVARLVNNLPAPIPVEFSQNGSCPTLAVFFASQTEMLKTFQIDQALAGFLRDNKPSSKQITALLMMEKFEKTIFGAELSGNVVVRDVPQVTVTFLNQRFLEPAYTEKETRRKLETSAFDQLLRIAHRRVATAKSVRKDLERSRALLQSKLALLQRGDWNNQEPESDDMTSIAGTEEQLRRVEEKLMELGSEERMLDSYLNITINILSHPEEHLWETKQHMILDQRGIKRTQPTENDSEFTFQELCNSDGQQWVMLLVALPVDDLLNIRG